MINDMHKYFLIIIMLYYMLGGLCLRPRRAPQTEMPQKGEAFPSKHRSLGVLASDHLFGELS